LQTLAWCWSVRNGASLRSRGGLVCGCRLEVSDTCCNATSADEVHLLNESRGSSLEGVVARIKMVSR
jgi:hypothetical protein